MNWNTPILGMLDAVRAPGKHLIVGDFNLHHPLWGGPAIHQPHNGAELLIDGIELYNLDLLLPPRTITQEFNQQRSSLDLAICTPNLTRKVRSCGITDQFSGSDHRPIETIIETEGGLHQPTQPRKCWKKMQYDALQAGANWLRMPGDMTATSQVDDYVNYLIQFIQNLIEQTAPTSKGSE